VHAVVDRPAAQIVDEVVSRLNQFRGSPRPEDDVTLVVIKVVSFNAVAHRVEVSGEE